MQTRPLHPRFGVEIEGVDLRTVSASRHYRHIRALFEEHSVLLFKRQTLDDDAHTDLASQFGPIEDRAADAARTRARTRPPVPLLTNLNEAGDGALAPNSLTTLNLVANSFWHTDSTFLRKPALLNAITARVVPSSGGATELVSTRAAWDDLPPALQRRAEATVFLHSVLPSRIQTDARLLEIPEVTRYQGQAWRAHWPNPENGRNALYIANHIYGARDCDWRAARAFAEDLIERATQPECIYAHEWETGDVLIWDERATMHRVRPWPYEEVRTLASICVTAGGRDGVDLVTPADGPIRDDELFQAA
ncbi:MAG: TauD/TfdA family dioxygenase [Pseudomonadota bacterium]